MRTCSACGDEVTDNERCSCQVIDDQPAARAARRTHHMRRRERMRAAGPIESFTDTEIGNRDGWVCGICQDTSRLVDQSPSAPRALSPSIDHIVAVAKGGAHTRANVRIAHLWCNVERNSSQHTSAQLMRSKLSLLLDGQPIPEELYRSASPRRRWPASPRSEYMIALRIAVGQVAADPRYGDAATRLDELARLRFGDAAAEAIQSSLNWANKTRRRRAPIDARWRAPKRRTET